jgi:signal transduction histidine kinase
MTDWGAMPITPIRSLTPIRSITPTPIDGAALGYRLRLTGVSLVQALLAIPALVLAIGSILSVALGPLLAGIVLAHGVVPATAALTGLHRQICSALLGTPVRAGYADTSDRNLVTRPLRWLTDSARWRDVAFLWFSATGGFVLSLVPVALLSGPLVHLTGAILDGGVFWWLLALLGGPLLVVWWLITPALAQARARSEAKILGQTPTEELRRRVVEVSASRADTRDHSAAELRRIERDLHDGAQARIAAVGMSVGLAEKLMRTDPEAASALLREARATSVEALEDLRSVVRGIHPPALADRGLQGGVEALALLVPLPVTVSLRVPTGVPEPVQSAVYFAVAECLSNIVKHAQASRAWLAGGWTDGTLTVTIGDDGRGDADSAGSGLAGIARRLAAFDGTVVVASPAGGPTVVTLGVPCPIEG